MKKLYSLLFTSGIAVIVVTLSVAEGLAQGSWMQKADFGGTARAGAVGFSIGVNAYIGTGWDGVKRNDFWEYNYGTNTWTQKADFAGSARDGAVGFSIGNNGYIGLGNVPGLSRDFWEYNSSTNVWTQKADFGGTARSGAVGFSIGLKGYIGTGYDGIGPVTKDFWEYNPSNDTWTQKSDFGGGYRSNSVGFSILNKGYVGTGYDNVNYKSDFWQYNPNTDTWIQKANFPGTARMQASCFSFKSFGFIGLGNDGSYHFDFWKYDTLNNTWATIGNFPSTPRIQTTGFSIMSKGYIGTGWDALVKKDFWQFNPWSYSFTASNDSICLPDTITFTNTTNDPDAYIYQWRFASQAFADTIIDTLSTSVQYVFDTLPGTWNVSITIFDTNLVTVGTYSMNVFISELTSLNLTSFPSSCTANTGVAMSSPAGGAIPYTYQWSNNGSTQNISGLSAGYYSLIVDDKLGCNIIDSVFVTKYCFTASTDSICLPDTVTFTNTTSDPDAYSYEWWFMTPGYQDTIKVFDTLFTTLQYVYDTLPGTHHIQMFVSDTNGAYLGFSSMDIFVSAISSVSFSTTPASCMSADGSASANPSGGVAPYSFLWSNGSSAQMASGLNAGTYTVTIIDNIGCAYSDTVSIGISNAVSTPPICMVTVDSLSQNNVIMWDKTSFNYIDSFIVYREVGLNNYQPIGAVPYDSLSLFVDTVRTKYFPNTGDPNAGTYKYKIAMRDSCGNYSPLSQDHNTIFINNNSGVFSWAQLYLIGGSTNPVNNYMLMRDNLSNGNWVVVNSVAGSQQTVTDPQYSTYQATAKWRVETQWSISCNPTRINPTAANFNASLSNIFSNVNAVNEIDLNNYVSVYPNPTDGEFTIYNSLPDKNVELKITNAIGETILKKILSSKQEAISLNALNGVYFLHIKTKEGSAVKKIVVQY